MRRLWTLVKPFLRTFAYSLIVWWALAVPIVYQAYMGNLANGRIPPARVFVLHPLIRYTLIAFFTVGILELAKRFPLQRRVLVRNLAVHFVGLSVFIVGFAYARYLSLKVFPLPMPDRFLTFLEQMIATTIVQQVWSYAGVVAVAHAINYARLAKEREIERAELRARVAQQQLDILKLQLQPHFLFNTLHGISSLMDTDVPRARTAIATLSDLLRMALDGTNRNETTLSEELSFVSSYLTLEKLRLGDRLQSSVNVDPSVNGAIVPTMVLQPLVENAIRHGVEARRAPSKVDIRIDRHLDRLRMAIVNDAPPPESNAQGSGVGLTNTRERLRALYESQQDLTITRTGDAVQVMITLPYRCTTT